MVDYFDWEENDTHEESVFTVQFLTRVFDLQLYGRQMAFPQSQHMGCRVSDSICSARRIQAVSSTSMSALAACCRYSPV